MRLQGFVTVFPGIFIEALPFLMAGVLVSSVIARAISPDQIRRYSPRNPLLGALGGALLGLAFPVCECGSIPAARRLLSKGFALPSGIAFALAAPVINPVVLVSTFVAFQSWEMVAWRAGLTIAIAVIVGMLVLARRPPVIWCWPQAWPPAIASCSTRSWLCWRAVAGSSTLTTTAQWIRRAAR